MDNNIINTEMQSESIALFAIITTSMKTSQLTFGPSIIKNDKIFGIYEYVSNFVSLFNLYLIDYLLFVL